MSVEKSRFPIGQRKIAIVGVGFVGASIAYALTLRDLAQEIILIDQEREKADGEAMDIQHGIPYMGASSVRVGDYCDCADCDLIIITAGRNRRPGETRLNMIEDNSKIMRNVIDSIMKYYNNSVIMVVSNPVDILVSLCYRWTGLPNGRIFGTGCTLDTSRFVRCVADYIGLSTDVVRGFVVGEHGDSQVPLWSRLSIGGASMEEYCASLNLAWTQTERDQIAETVKKTGTTIISKKGKTHYGIATCVCMLADAVLNQHPTIASVSTPLQGEYGISGVALSVPCRVSAAGAVPFGKAKLTEQELADLRASAETIRAASAGLL